MLASALFGLLGTSLLALAPVRVARLETPHYASSDFGRSLAWTDTDLLVGAPTSAFYVGEAMSEGALLFSQADFSLAQPLTLWADTKVRLLGSSVALQDATMVLGAPADLAGTTKLAGAVYTLTWDGALWQELAGKRLVAPTPELGQRFGYSLAYDGTQLLVGAPGANTANDKESNAGAIFVYEDSGGTWSLKQTLHAAAPHDQAELGTTLALDSHWLATSVVGQESLAIFARDPETRIWTQRQLVDAASLAEGGCLDPNDPSGVGSAVALQGDVLVVGAPAGTTAAEGGVVYVLRLTGETWTCVDALTPPIPGGAENFGSALAFGPELLLVGASNHSSELPAQGALYVLRAEGSSFVHEGRSLGLKVQDRLGTSLAVQGTRIAAQVLSELPDQLPAVMVFDLLPSLGEACAGPDLCAEGSCEAGICCAEACAGACFACAPEGSSIPGSCVFQDGLPCQDGEPGCEDSICRAEQAGGTSQGSSTTDPESSSSGDFGMSTSSGDPPQDPPKSEAWTAALNPDGCLCDSHQSTAPGLSGFALLLLLAGRRRRNLSRPSAFHAS